MFYRCELKIDLKMLKITKIYLHRLINTINNWYHVKPIKNASELDFSKVSVINWLDSSQIWPTAWLILLLEYKTSLRYIFHQLSSHHITMGSTKFKMTKLTRKIHVSIAVKFGKCSVMFSHSSKSHFQESFQEKFQVHKKFSSIF